MKISWKGLEEYFFSISGNGLLDLTFFIAFVLSLFYGKHLWFNLRFRHWRNSIPLTVGGWGTRGKSGTERLKAAIFNALGYSVISKTTGCEAMFIYTPACGDPKEMFLFRPYDKATIWEQSDLLKISSLLGAEVFLWECMALTPSYVKILQQDWMRDELATLTNTFPDHENLQGPAGYNIPEVMTEFISNKGHVITTEESMFPILKESAHKKQASIEGLGWLEAGLISQELLDQFPYEEHPYNIVLVASMAQKLGFETDRAIKEMSDRVMADLGVLKTYPSASVLNRQLEFVMGMSANERYGCLGNWSRMKFDEESSFPENGVWVSTVVNNRADRIARSEVFARILVHDIQVDKHILIGTNLSGLLSYIESERENYKASLFGKAKLKTSLELIEIIQQEAIKLRLNTTIPHLKNRLKHFINSQFLEGFDDIKTLEQWKNNISKNDKLNSDQVSWANQFSQDFLDYVSLINTYKNNDNQLVSLKPVVEWMDNLFNKKIVVIQDPSAKGDQVIKTIADSTPPNFKNRIMGMQNIKGTGLDFVYRWQAWEQIHQWGQDLISSDKNRALSALEQLVSFQEFGLLDHNYLADIIIQARHLPNAQNESFQAMLNRLETKHQLVFDVLETMNDHEPTTQPNFIQKFFSFFEPLLDSGDAIYRRKKADQIYHDLTHTRISMDEASVELRKLTKRQKGGWLFRKD